MEVEGPWSEVFEGSERRRSSVEEEEELLGSSTLTLAPLLSTGPPTVPRTQPLAINRSRTKRAGPLFSSIPNPFPELCSPSQAPVLIGSLSPPSSNTHLIRVFGEDSHSRSVWVSATATAREVCHMLVQTAHCSDQENWALIELHPALGLERCLEDHEVVLEVQATWPPEGDTKLLFRKNYAKYEFFRKPMQFFPENMISDSADVNKGMTSSELIQNLLMSGTCPEIQGFLHVREPNRKAWKRVYFFLRRSGLYCSTKGSSKEPRHLQYVADLEDLNVYTVANSHKRYGAPVDFTFCVKKKKNSGKAGPDAISRAGNDRWPIRDSRDPGIPSETLPLKERTRAQDLKLLCAENEQTRTCWTSSFRLFKYGRQLHVNYQLSQSAPPLLERTLRTDAKRCGSESSLVAMDFSGKAGGRVIQNPREAQNAEREEGQAWRRREALRCSLPNLSPGSRPASIHRTQPWFHGGVSRKEAQKLIEEQGLVDGMFLIRESQQHAQCFVLSLCYKLKTKHYLVIPCEEGGRKYYTMDDGLTLFIDLLQLVEFHQINKGILPVCLKHPCVCVAL